MKKYTILALMVLAVVILGGCATMPDYGAEGQAYTDDQIAAAINSRLNDDAVTSKVNIYVNVQDGIATLNGRVPGLNVRSRAVGIARSTDGVKDVIDELRDW